MIVRHFKINPILSMICMSNFFRVVKWAKNQIALVAKLRFFRNFAIFRDLYLRLNCEKFQNFQFQAEIEILNENHKNDNQGEFTDFNEFTLMTIWARKWKF